MKIGDRWGRSVTGGATIAGRPKPARGPRLGDSIDQRRRPHKAGSRLVWKQATITTVWSMRR